MLSQQTLDALAVNSGIEADVLAQAISDEQEQTLELPKGRFLTSENESKLLDNHGKKKYDEGKSKTLKDVFEGKTREDFLKDYKDSVLEEANLEPNQKLEEKNTIIEDLQNKLRGKDQEIETIMSENTKKQRVANALSQMPELKDGLGISKSEALNLILSNSELKEDGIYSNGTLLTDDYQSPIEVKDFLLREVNSRGWSKKKIQGNGGRKPGQQSEKISTYTEFQKYCESKGWNESSQEAISFLNKVKKDNSDFDFDN